MTRAIIVTGGAGYIGSHTCKALHDAGYLPIAIDNLSLGHERFVKWGPLIRADLFDVDAVQRTMRAYNAAAVIHFAAYAYVGESVVDPEKYYRNNVAGTLALLEAMAAANLKRIVFSSTCAIYGEPKSLPIDERTAANPINPYGRSKLMCEDILRDYGPAYQMKSIILRYFNASGADLDGDVGELRDPETHLIPRAMMALQGYIDDFQVFGNDFPTPDGTAIRDYIHVSDLADAHVLAVKRLLDGGSSDTFNLGGGTGQSVGAVLREIEAVSGLVIAPPTGARRDGDPAQLVADTSRARSTLGFTPTRSSLSTIVESAWRWHLRAHPIRREAMLASRL